uniref:Uncharacterized protein n=1 Tax=Anopheles minimus TaxID=112268 RepID=A0A182WPF1_9DIPT
MLHYHKLRFPPSLAYLHCRCQQVVAPVQRRAGCVHDYFRQ